MNGFDLPGMGWRRDVPDSRDYSPLSPEIEAILARMAPDHRSECASAVDLREYFSEVDHQGKANCSCAHACVGLVEYFRGRCLGETAKLAPQFVYSVSRRLLGLSGNVCTEVRATLKAIKLAGIPAERFSCQADSSVSAEPDAFMYSFRDSYSSIRYVRLDTAANSGKTTLDTVQAFLAAGFPVVFGFPVPSSVTQDADIPFRPRYDSILGGQAVVAVGYDDDRFHAARGALLIRNSWGPSWGDKGYGWLPYSYVRNSLAADFWTTVKSEWLENSDLRRPVL